MPVIEFRNFRSGDEAGFLEVLKRAFGGLEYLAGAKNIESSPGFDPNGFFFAETGESLVGCVGVFSRVRQKCFGIEYLAVAESSSWRDVAEGLLAKALHYTKSKNADLIMASTLALPCYVDLYKSFNFTPTRRIQRITWDLSEAYEAKARKVEIQQVSDNMRNEAASVFANSLLPYWDWWIEERGGVGAVMARFKERARGKEWACALSDGKIVGLTRVSPDFYGPGEAGFWGVYVLPEFRGRGIGSALIIEAIRRAKSLGQKKITVFTVASLDTLLPGGVLYLKSGGKIEAEYLHMAGPIPPTVSGLETEGSRV